MKYLLALECLIRIFYFSIVIKKNNFKSIVEQAKRSQSFIYPQTTSDELYLSFLLVRKFLNLLLLNNICLLTTLSYFSMAPKLAKIHISASDFAEEFEAHAWLELPNQKIITTDVQKTNDNSMVIEKL